MNNVLTAIQHQHDEDIRFLEKMLKSTIVYEQDYVKLLSACFSTKKNPHSFLPIGYTEDFISSRAAAKFAEALHHALCNDDNYAYNVEFGIVDGNIFFEFIHSEPSSSIDDRKLAFERKIYSQQSHSRFNAKQHNISINDFVKYLED